jgi:hypothetical protein
MRLESVQCSPSVHGSDIEPPRLSIIDLTNSVHIYRHPEMEKLSLFSNFEKLFFVKSDLSAIFTFSGVSPYFHLIDNCFIFSSCYCFYFFLGGGGEFIKKVGCRGAGS